MRHLWMAVATCCALAACGDPLRGIERVSEVPDALPDTDRATLATPDDTTDDTPIFAGLFRRAKPAPDPSVDAAVNEALGADARASAAGAPPQEAETAAQNTIERTSVPRRSGLMGWLRPAEPVEPNGAAQRAADTPRPEQADTPADDGTTLAAARGDTEAEGNPARRGLFRPRAARDETRARTGPDARDVPGGTVLPFGQVARVCDAKPRDMGKIVERAARKGKGYELYDSQPGSAQSRVFYVTGFSDNCPRQFTAAVALFGTPQAHEQLRYGLPARNYPYSTTDEAYEKIKSRVCNVGRKKPCGARISRFDKTTIFVSAYENFGENARWADMLLHEGEVLATALKSP